MKKILAIFLAAFMVVSLLPTVAFAETTTVASWGDLVAAIEKADTIQLGADISALDGDSTIEIGKKLTLDLNGYMLDANWDESHISSVITLQDGADLTIKDSANPSANPHDIYSCNGRKLNLGHWITYKPDGYDDEKEVYKKHIVINGGLITGTYECAGVYVDEGAKCTLESGTIAGNVADYYGGGVYVENEAQFIMNGGAISYNEASYGGGVAVGSRETAIDFGEFILNGGTISNNTAWTRGGGVYVSAYPKDNEGPYFTMTGGTISDNESYGEGGGVALEDCDAYTYSSTIHAIIMNMTGGTITKNYCGTYGGGVFFDGMYEYGSVMLGGTAVISGNWYGDPLNPQPDDYNDNLYIDDGYVDDSIGYIKFDESTAPASGMNVGVMLATGTGDLTTTLNSIPKGILGYLYSDNTEYMVATDSDKVVLKEAPDIIIGDADGNKRLEANDITTLINELLNGAECNEVLDCNGDGAFDILDLVALKKYFATGTPLGKTE